MVIIGDQLDSRSVKIDILSQTLPELKGLLLDMGEPEYRAKQIFVWFHRKRILDFDEMSDIPLSLRTKLADYFYIKSLKIVRTLASKQDNTVKYLYELPDGEHVETVLMEYEHGNSICLSTQVGCRMGCHFCASCIAGFSRNLTASEILLQIYNTELFSHREVSSIVLMGIGEPLDNFDEVTRFLDVLSSKQGRNMSLRHLSLSTCGLVDGIDLLSEKNYPLTLSISLHAVTDETRNQIMPVNKKYPIATLLSACDRYFAKTGRRISFEYAVIEGVNDSFADAKGLATLLRQKNCHINLIPVNRVKERNFRSNRQIAARFCGYLTDMGMNATVRRTLGDDISAACGQLRRDYESDEQ